MPKSTDTIDVMKYNAKIVEATNSIYDKAVTDDTLDDLSPVIKDARAQFQAENYNMLGSALCDLTPALIQERRKYLE